MEFRAKPPLQAGNARVLVPSDLFFLQQRPASPTIAGTRASGPSIIATSPEKAPQMDEEASRCFICCKCSVCMSVVVCVCVCSIPCAQNEAMYCRRFIPRDCVSDQVPLHHSSTELL